MKTVRWSNLAFETYWTFSEEIAVFSQRTAITLEDKLNALLDRLAVHEHACPPLETLSRYRKCVLSKNISLIYEVTTDSIELVSFIDNRMEHGFI
ncbi:MAG: hypothetical protein H7246_03235 [Phycisphaerae bacterium]|nr:hypothetical protein [Saprospiraceae bacterium]